MKDKPSGHAALALGAMAEAAAVGRAIKDGHRKTEARVITENALRWCGNMLTEVQGNHGEHIPAEVREALRVAVAAVHAAAHEARR